MKLKNQYEAVCSVAKIGAAKAVKICEQAAAPIFNADQAADKFVGAADNSGHHAGQLHAHYHTRPTQQCY